MTEIPYDADQIRATDCLFPPEIELDPWVLFHGTSSFYSDSIELNGLRWQGKTYSRSEIETVVSILRRMRWCGLPGNHLRILRSFSLEEDFGASDSKPIYLAETSRRALTYATREFAGGETARSLRGVFSELAVYLTDAEVRAEHCGYLNSPRLGYFTAPLGDLPPIDADGAVSRDWLAEQLHRLSDLRDRVVAPFAAHLYGIVYALRLAPADIPRLDCRGMHGVALTAPLPPAHIVARVRIPISVVPTGLSSPVLMAARLRDGGILQQIVSRARKDT